MKYVAFFIILLAASTSWAGQTNAPGSNGNVLFNSLGNWGATSILTIGTSSVGGSGVSSLSAANTLVSRDSNSVSYAAEFVSAFTGNACAGTITLTAASNHYQNFSSGSGSCTVVLPDATTLVNGRTFEINNNASGTLTIQDGSAATLTTVPAGGYIKVVLMSNSFTAGQWDYHNSLAKNTTSGTSVFNIGSSAAYQINGVNAINFPTSDTTAGGSIAIGASALSGQTSSSAYGNTAVGYQALGSSGLTSVGTSNASFGYQSGSATTSGYDNAFFGYQSGSASTSGYANTSIGFAACKNITTGHSNFCAGYNAGVAMVGAEVGNIYINATGSAYANNNVWIGGGENGAYIGNSTFINAGGYASGCSYCVAIGGAGGELGNSTGQYNVALGKSSAVQLPAYSQRQKCG